jgi:hypothetical protein
VFECYYRYTLQTTYIRNVSLVNNCFIISGRIDPWNTKTSYLLNHWIFFDHSVKKSKVTSTILSFELNFQIQNVEGCCYRNILLRGKYSTPGIILNFLFKPNTSFVLSAELAYWEQSICFFLQCFSWNLFFQDVCSMTEGVRNHSTELRLGIARFNKRSILSNLSLQQYLFVLNDINYWLFFYFFE